MRVREDDMFLDYVKIFIKAGSCGVVIGKDIKPEKSKGECAKKEPSDKAEIEAEKLSLVAVHHAAAFRDSFTCGKVGIIAKDIVGHGVGIGFYNPRNDKKQTP